MTYVASSCDVVYFTCLGILGSISPMVPPSTLTTLLFDASRLLSVVPALLGALINAWCVWKPPGLYSGQLAPGSCSRINREHDSWGRIALPDRADYFLAVLWVRFYLFGVVNLPVNVFIIYRRY